MRALPSEQFWFAPIFIWGRVTLRFPVVEIIGRFTCTCIVDEIIPA
ncbi:MAG: hypothetical protein ABJ275_09520 [Maricaulaceae bacterium]